MGSSGRRTIGRRKTDRYRVAAGMLLGAVLAAYGLYTGACDTAGPTKPDVVAQAPAPVVAAPAPTPTPTPKVVESPPPTTAFELWGEPGACLKVKYNGEASRAEVETSRRGFDDAKASNFKTHTIDKGGTITRCFNEPCIEGDAEQVNVKPIGGIWFDINMNPFTNPEKNQDKVNACRNQCDPKWVPIGEGDGWSQCSPVVGESAVTAPTCQQSRRVKNTCTGEVKSETRPCECPCVETQEPNETPLAFSWAPDVLQDKCEQEQFPLEVDTFTPQLNCHQIGTQKIGIDWLCKADGERIRNLCKNVACPTPPPCVPPPVGTTLTNNVGNGSIDTECAAFGAYVGVQKQENWPWEFTSAYAFLICKAGTDRIVEPVGKFDLRCSNGKDISHVTACTCE